MHFFTFTFTKITTLYELLTNEFNDWSTTITLNSKLIQINNKKLFDSVLF